MARKDKVGAPAGRDMKHPFLVPVVCATLAAGATLGAYSASGFFQVVLIVLAVLLSVYTAISYVAAGLVTILDRPSSRSSRGAARESMTESLWCAHGKHDDCPHLHGIEHGASPGRGRAGSAGLLCTCECHSSCLVRGKRGTVAVRDWRDSCICPGAESTRSVIGRDDESGRDA